MFNRALHATMQASQPILIRRATDGDEPDILALVRSERLNPFDLDWRRFTVATDGTGIVGAVQLRRHADGSRELGSLVVRRGARGRGIASRLIDATLSVYRLHVFMITGARFAHHYERWGFRRVGAQKAPWPVLRNYWLGRLAAVQSFLAGRQPNTLALLEREPVAAPWRSQGSSPAV